MKQLIATIVLCLVALNMSGQSNALALKKAALSHVKVDLYAPTQFILTDEMGNRIGVDKIYLQKLKVSVRYDTTFVKSVYDKDSVRIEKYFTYPYKATIHGDAMVLTGGYKHMTKVVYISAEGFTSNDNLGCLPVKTIKRKCVKPYIPPTEPEFIGGGDSLIAFIQSNLKYPPVAEENGIQGRVIMDVTIGEDGSVIGYKVEKSVSHSLDNEAIRITKKLPKFKPSIFEGKPKESHYRFPVTFRLH